MKAYCAGIPKKLKI